MIGPFERVSKRIESYTDYVIDLEKRLTAIPALDPSSGGEGEAKKAELLLAMLAEIGIHEVEVYKAPDPKVPSGSRPNIVARIPGRDRTRALWLMAHMDVVPTGERKTWSSDPFVARVDGRKIYGRGVEDNQQGIVSSLCLARALIEEKAAPPIDLGLLFVADEETGNKLGIEYLLEHHETFRKGDLIIVPDGGLPDGSMIEVAEKGILWLKFTVKGKQTHGSTPEKGVNAHTAAAHLVVKLEELRERFSARDEVFDPPISTFESTKVEAGAPNINSIPGEHTFYMDSRVMPNYKLDAVLEVVKGMARAVDEARKTTTEIEVVQRQDAAPPTSTEAPVVSSLKRAVKAVYGVEAKPMGIGGGTVAAFIRRHGFPAAVWATMDETMHGPDEYTIIDNILGDARVFAHVLLV